jgi:hypothetical protein
MAEYSGSAWRLPVSISTPLVSGWSSHRHRRSECGASGSHERTAKVARFARFSRWDCAAAAMVQRPCSWSVWEGDRRCRSRPNGRARPERSLAEAHPRKRQVGCTVMEKGCFSGALLPAFFGRVPGPLITPTPVLGRGGAFGSTRPAVQRELCRAGQRATDRSARDVGVKASFF